MRAVSLASVAVLAFLTLLPSGMAGASCTSPANAIESENCLPGTPKSVWYISGSGDSTIQGFATDISFNVGQTVHFKINTSATSYVLDIYRLGFYQGKGARLITRIAPSAHLPQSQPACLRNSTTKLLDCGNWAISASCGHNRVARTSTRPSDPFPNSYGTISNAVFSLPPSLRPALVHAGTPCGQWATVQFPNAMPM